MADLLLHHISLVSKNLDASAAFYRDVIGLAEVERPAFPIAGRWLRTGTVEVHLIDRPDGSFRATRDIDHNDIHFAIRVADFEGEVARLKKLGFQDEQGATDGKILRINRSGKAGYPQIYLTDPDGHVIEINATSL
jgi:catechol 2,3-dioxygenase-like lactoylglutathione lyase family enzyme